MPCFFIQLLKLAGVVPLASKASISGRKGSSLLLPGPFGRPNETPAAFLARRASLVR